MDSKTVFELRKEAKDLSGESKLMKLNDALRFSNQLYREDSNDEWNQKALAWTLIDLCKYYIALGNLNQASDYYNNLQSIVFDSKDELIEKQKSFLRPQIDPNYSEVSKAEELSKNGQHQESIALFKRLISEDRLSELHHESYGWAIYRKLKNNPDTLSSLEVRKYLRDYMNLKNERPSLLHSMILNFAVHYSKDHSDLDLYNFFKLWNPKFLRTEDKENQQHEGKEIPSLISRVIREFVDKDYNFDVEYLIENINMGKVYSFGFDDDLLF